jgi:hypothetical protein
MPTFALRDRQPVYSAALDDALLLSGCEGWLANQIADHVNNDGGKYRDPRLPIRNTP